jgi:PTS system N-acetylglucosamine-specific IIC component
VRFDLRTPGREREAAASMTQSTSSDGAPGAYIAALGGAANLESVDACTTRLRLVLRERSRMDTEALRRLGASGTVNIGGRGVQVVVGPVADQLAGDIRARLSGGSKPLDRAGWIAALGGPANVARVEPVPGRVLFTVKDAARIDARRLADLGARAVGTPSATSVHVLHADAEALAAALAEPA